MDTEAWVKPHRPLPALLSTPAEPFGGLPSLPYLLSGMTSSRFRAPHPRRMRPEGLGGCAWGVWKTSFLSVCLLPQTWLRKPRVIYSCRKSQAFLGQTRGSFRNVVREFPPGRVVKVHLPCSVGDMSLIPGQGTKIPHATEQLISCATTRESAPQRETPHDPTKILPAATKT